MSPILGGISNVFRKDTRKGGIDYGKELTERHSRQVRRVDLE